VRSGSSEIMYYILAARPMLNSCSRQGISPLMLAAILGNYTIFTMLVDVGSFLGFQLQGLRLLPVLSLDLDNHVTHGSDVLILAVQNGNSKIVKFSLARGCNIKTTSDEGLISLTAAPYNGHLNCVMELLDHGTDFEARANNDFKPFIYYEHFGHIEVATALVETDAEIEAKKERGMTPLLEAAWKGRAELWSSSPNKEQTLQCIPSGLAIMTDLLHCMWDLMIIR
jgi:ankyrin repeat protein